MRGTVSLWDAGKHEAIYTTKTKQNKKAKKDKGM